MIRVDSPENHPKVRYHATTSSLTIPSTTRLICSSIIIARELSYVCIMPEGGCFCAKVRYSVEGEPLAKALCHCLDCRKITGSTYSTNLIVAGSNFKLLSGTPKSFAKTADSGREIVSHFCGDCGSTLWRDGASFGENKVIKVGTLDDIDALDKAQPAVELFSSHRVSWVGEITGAAQKTTM